MNQTILSVVAGVAAFLSLSVISLLDASLGEGLLLMAPFGATAVLVFGVPESPLAQPKNVIVGHLITAFIGVFFTQYVGVTPLTLALATGMAISAMLLTKTTHPPAGANPILIMLAGQSWSFLVMPVLLGSVLIVLMSKSTQLLLRRWAN